MAFSMVSWNILAPVHVRPERYPRVPAEILEGTTRLRRIVDRLRELNPDVIALQEVEPGWVEALNEGLRDREYDWRLTLKQGGQFEGVALFIRRERFAGVRFEEVYYREGVAGLEATGNVALLAHVQDAGRPLLLATTHIKWELLHVEVSRHRGAVQVRQLTERLAQESPRPAMVVTGDFNATADSPVLAPLWSLGFQDPFAADDQPTGAFNRQATRIDFLLHTTELAVTGDALPHLTNASVLPSVEEPSDHLPLRARVDWR